MRTDPALASGTLQWQQACHETDVAAHMVPRREDTEHCKVPVTILAHAVTVSAQWVTVFVRGGNHRGSNQNRNQWAGWGGKRWNL